MSKRERIRVLRERTQAGGADSYYDEPQYQGDTISDKDIETLLKVSDQFDLHDYSDNRHEKLLRHAVRIAENAGGLTDALEDREAAEALVRWINREYENPRTKCDYRLAIRAVGKHALRRGTRVKILSTTLQTPMEGHQRTPSGLSRSHFLPAETIPVEVLCRKIPFRDLWSMFS